MDVGAALLRGYSRRLLFWLQRHDQREIFTTIKLNRYTGIMIYTVRN